MFKKQLRVFVLCLLVMATGALLAKQSFANTSLVLPAYLHHIQHADKYEYNEGWFANEAIGFEYEGTDLVSSLVYVNSNSHEKKSLYGYSMFYTKLNADLRLGAGLVAAIGGYPNPIIAPMIALKYKWVQVSTTTPAAAIAKQPADLLNIQLVIPVGN